MKVTLSATAAIEVIRYGNETYFALGTTNRTLGGGGTNANFADNKGFILDANISRYVTGTTAITFTPDKNVEVEFDMLNPITRYDGVIYYRPVGGRGGC